MGDINRELDKLIVRFLALAGVIVFTIGFLIGWAVGA